MRKMLQAIAICFLASGCASSPPGPTARPWTGSVGPFVGTFDDMTKGLEAQLAAGRSNDLLSLSENVSAMAAWSLWAFYPTNGTFAGTADRQFTDYIYTAFEADFTHWKRVMLFGSPADRSAAVEMLRSRARSLVNGYPFSAERSRTEDIGFACVVALMSEYVLADLVPLVRQNMSRWPTAGQTVGLCVLAHEGDRAAQEKLTTLSSVSDRSVIGVYRTTSHTKEKWPNGSSQAVGVSGAPQSGH